MNSKNFLEGGIGWHISMPTTKKEMNNGILNKSNGVERRDQSLQILYFVGADEEGVNKV